MIWILLIILVLGIILLTIGICNEFEGFQFLGTIISVVAITAITLNYYEQEEKIESFNKEIKIDLPEEIYEARKGDTLYINKRTKDSIYLGFKPIKE